MGLDSRVLQLDVQGSFDFYTSAVSIDAVTSKEFLQLGRILGPARRGRRLTLEQFQAADRVLPLITHELTHFIDATSTSWGLQRLRQLDLAYRAMLSENEFDFHHLKTAYDSIRTIRLPDYYTLISDIGKRVVRPWSYKVSIGVRYKADGRVDDAHPIAFCRFATENGDLLARSPLSVVSLLEASAMSQELQLRYVFLLTVDGIEGIVEQRRQQQKALDYLYDHSITEYSVCAHLVANYQQCKDVLLAYRLAGVLSRLALNWPRPSFLTVSNRATLGKVLNVDPDHPYIDRVSRSLQGSDRGTLYSVLCAALPADSSTADADVAACVELALQRLGTSFADVSEHARQEVDRLTHEISTSPSDVLRRLATAGRHNYELISPFVSTLPLQDLNLPMVLFGDYVSMRTHGRDQNTLGDLDPRACDDELYPLEKAIRNFAEACV